MEVITINKIDLQVKEWNGQRVVTLADIDKVHERPDGTAKRNWNENKKHLIKDEDYFLATRKELSTKFVPNKPLKGNPNIEVVLLTESGYLLLVKSFTDDLAWEVQRKLVNSYFRLGEIIQSQQVQNELILSNKLDKAIATIETCKEMFELMMDYSTINYKQQQDLLQVARQRVNYLLDGAHSERYKMYSRVYFKNLWQDFCKVFNCESYKNLNPLYMADNIAQNWIVEGNYIEQ